MDNTNNIQDNSNQDLTNSVSEQFESPQNLSAQDSCEQENLESTTEDEYTSLLNRISSLENLYSKDNASLFEIIQQYDKLIDQINDLKKIHENLKADSMNCTIRSKENLRTSWKMPIGAKNCITHYRCLKITMTRMSGLISGVM